MAEELVQNYEFGYHKENSANYGFDRNEHCVHRQIFEDEVEIKAVEEKSVENDAGNDAIAKHIKKIIASSLP